MNTMQNVYTTESIEENLPERLKIFRKNSGLTINEVGEMLNKTSSAVSMWETGKSLPDIDTLFKLCNIYKVSDVNVFFDTRTPEDVKSLTRSEQELISLWRKSHSTVRAAVKTLLKQCNK